MSTSSTVEVLRQLLGPVDLEVGRGRGGPGARPGAPLGRRVLLAAEGVVERARGGRGGTGRRTRTAWSSPRAPLPGRRDRSDGRRRRRAGAGRRGRRGPSGRSAGCRAASAPADRRRGSGSRPPRAGGPGRRAPRGRGRPRRRAGRATSSRSMAAEVGRRVDVGELRPRARPWPGAARSGRAPARARAAPRRRIVALAEAAGHEQVDVRRQLGEIPAQPVVAQERVHHRCSSARCCGLIDRRSDCIAAIRWASWSMMSSKRPRAREEPAVLGEELVDCVLARLAAADPLLDQRVEVADHLAVGGEILRGHALDRLGQARRRTGRGPACGAARRSSLNRSRAAGSMKSYSSSPRIRSPTSRGRRVELVEPAGGGVAEHRPERRVRPRAVGRRGFEPPRRGGARCPARSWATISSSSWRMSARTSSQLVALLELVPAATEALAQLVAGPPGPGGSGRRSASRDPSAGGAPRRGRPRPSRRRRGRRGSRRHRAPGSSACRPSARSGRPGRAAGRGPARPRAGAPRGRADRAPAGLAGLGPRPGHRR